MIVFSHGSFLDLAVYIFGVWLPVGAVEIDLERNLPRFLILDLGGRCHKLLLCQEYSSPPTFVF
jgi:hypothetical protein